jgi:hypothetical protein
MKTLSRFVSKFTLLIVAVLSCFDRVLFKGEGDGTGKGKGKGKATGQGHAMRGRRRGPMSDKKATRATRTCSAQRSPRSKEARLWKLKKNSKSRT